MDTGVAQGQPGPGTFQKEQDMSEQDMLWVLSQGGLGEVVHSGNGEPAHTDPQSLSSSVSIWTKQV